MNQAQELRDIIQFLRDRFDRHMNLNRLGVERLANQLEKICPRDPHPLIVTERELLKELGERLCCIAGNLAMQKVEGWEAVAQIAQSLKPLVDPQAESYGKMLDIAPMNPTLPLSNIDEECRWLVRSMNQVPGIWTTESCCGHGKQPITIWFTVKDALALNPFMWAGCHRWWNWHPWRVMVCDADPNRDDGRIHLLLESKEMGQPAYMEAKVMAAGIEKYLAEWVHGQAKENAEKCKECGGKKTGCQPLDGDPPEPYVTTVWEPDWSRWKRR